MAINAFTWESGCYSVTYNNTLMGMTEQGFLKSMQPAYLPIRADLTGQTVLNGLQVGVAQCVIRFPGIEWIPATWLQAVPWLHADGTVGSEGKIVAAGSLVLTADTIRPLLLTKLIGTGMAVGRSESYYHAYPLGPLVVPYSAQRLRGVNVDFFCFPSVNVATYLPTFYSVAGG